MAIYETIGRIFSRQFILDAETKIQRAGYSFYAEEFIGFTLFLGLIMTGIVLILIYNTGELENINKAIMKTIIGTTGTGSILYFALTFILSAIIAYALLIFVIWVILDYQEDNRRREIEKHLPDYLILVASNVKAGILLEHAVWEAAKPEFGLLSQEMEKIAKLAIGGKSFPDILRHFNKRVGSKMINQVVSLLEESVTSGGEIANILEQTAVEMRSLQMIQREISSSMLMYSLFVVIAAAIATPFLYALSYNLVAMLATVFAKIPNYKASTGLSVISFSQPKITIEAFFIFSIVSIIMTTLSASLMYGMLRHNRYTGGLRAFIPMVIIALFLFFVMTSILAKMFAVA